MSINIQCPDQTNKYTNTCHCLDHGTVCICVNEAIFFTEFVFVVQGRLPHSASGVERHTEKHSVGGESIF